MASIVEYQRHITMVPQRYHNLRFADEETDCSTTKALVFLLNLAQSLTLSPDHCCICVSHQHPKWTQGLNNWRWHEGTHNHVFKKRRKQIGKLNRTSRTEKPLWTTGLIWNWRELTEDQLSSRCGWVAWVMGRYKENGLFLYTEFKKRLEVTPKSHCLCLLVISRSAKISREDWILWLIIN